MKYIQLLLIILPSFLFAQDNKVELLEINVDDGILLKGVNHYTDQSISFVVEISSVGFGLKKLETIAKNIPAGGEVDIITLKPTPNRECSYSAQFSYKAKSVTTKTIVTKTTTKSPVDKTTDSAAASTKVEAQAEMFKSELAPASETNKKGIVVYSKAGCGRCEYLTNYLNENKIPFADLNITTDEAANKEMSTALFASGFKGGSFTTPVIVVDGEVFYNVKDLKGFTSDLAKTHKLK